MDEVEVVAIKAKRIGGKVREIGERFTLKRRDARAAIALKFVTAATPEEAAEVEVPAVTAPPAAPAMPESVQAPQEAAAEAPKPPEEPDMPIESPAAAPDSAPSQPELPADDAKAVDAAAALEDKHMSAERVKRPYKRRDLQAQP